MRYEFATAQRIIVGPSSSAELADSARALGGRALLALGSGMAQRRSWPRGWPSLA